MNITRWIPFIIKAMSTVQKVHSAKGADKLKAVLEDLNDNIDVLEQSAGKDIIANDKVQSALVNAISAIKLLENAIKDAKQIGNM